MSWERRLERIGDAIVPGDARLPSFSKSGAVRFAPEAMGALAEADRKALLAVVGVLGALPRWAISLLFRLVGGLKLVPGTAGAPARLLWVGLRGLVLSLYYSEPEIRRRIGWDRKAEERR